MSTLHPEYGHYPEGTISKALFDKATREIANYLVSFSVEDRPSGSATLVTMDSRYGFVTAAHVVNDLYESRSESIGIIFCDRLHRLPIRKDHLAATRIGPTNEGSGPDLAFLEVLDTKALGAIKAIKAVFRHFYDHFELHPEFEWRSIKEDLEARQSKESDPPKSTNE
jgi:hypothetical protein